MDEVAQLEQQKVAAIFQDVSTIMERVDRMLHQDAKKPQPVKLTQNFSKLKNVQDMLDTYAEIYSICDRRVNNSQRAIAGVAHNMVMADVAKDGARLLI